MKQQQFSQYTTCLTLAAAAIGFTGYFCHFYIWGLFALIVLIPQLISFGHSVLKMASLTLTTFIFGIINAHSFLSLQHYLNTPNCPVPTLSIYLSLATIYHYFQFLLFNYFHYPQLEWHNFLIYHSKHYTMANCFLFLQHIITRHLLELSFKSYHPLMWPALVIAVAGETLRISAFFTCKSNFTHLVSFRKQQSHTLITNGVYAYFRHPAYTGYFYYCVFSQLFLGNIISTIGFFLTLTNFFQHRIKHEEQALIRFFPTQYPTYKRDTHICIPFVKNPDFSQHFQPDKEN